MMRYEWCGGEAAFGSGRERFGHSGASAFIGGSFSSDDIGQEENLKPPMHADPLDQVALF